MYKYSLSEKSQNDSSKIYHTYCKLFLCTDLLALLHMKQSGLKQAKSKFTAMNLILDNSSLLTTRKSGKFLTHLLCAYHFIFLTVISACGGWRLMCSWLALHSCILGFGSLTFNLIGFLFWFMGGIRSFWILCFRKREKKTKTKLSRKKIKISVECKSLTMFQ